MKVYLVIQLKDGRRGWYVGTDTRPNKFNQPMQVPIFDDEKAKQVDWDFAMDARSRWREYCQKNFQSDLHVSVEKYGAFVDEGRPEPTTPLDNRVPMFVFTVGDELGYLVHPVTPPSGPCWCLRFADTRLAEQSVFAESPEAVIAKARLMGFLEIESPQVSPFKAQKQQAEEANRNPRTPGLRPGDRRG